jgi:hypothetical protein
MGYKTISLEIDLDEFDDDELINELESRGYVTGDSVSSPDINVLEIISIIHERRRTGHDYQKALDELIYHTIGKIV